MNARRVVVCSPQIPFSTGGTEVLVDTLVASLRRRSLDTELIRLPFRSWPHEAVIRSAAQWKLLDLDQSEGDAPIEQVIATKFPSYFVRHSHKVVWLVHQFRQIYDWYESRLSPYNRQRPDDYQLVQWIVQEDRQALMEAKAVYTISENTRCRLMKFLGIEAKVMYPPPPMEGRYRCDEYAPEILLVQRLEPAKRTSLAIRALQKLSGEFRVTVVGTGPEEHSLRGMVQNAGMEDRVQFRGRVSREELLDLYAKCRLTLYVPLDEDYGIVPTEAFASRKPVVTASDSGGPLEFVSHRWNGWVGDPTPDSLAEGIQLLLEDISTAEEWGNNGYERIRTLNWNDVVNTLIKSWHPRSES